MVWRKLCQSDALNRGRTAQWSATDYRNPLKNHGIIEPS
jgi:hypothetical protein